MPDGVSWLDSPAPTSVAIGWAMVDVAMGACDPLAAIWPNWGPGPGDHMPAELAQGTDNCADVWHDAKANTTAPGWSW